MLLEKKYPALLKRYRQVSHNLIGLNLEAITVLELKYLNANNTRTMINFNPFQSLFPLKVFLEH